MGQSWGHLGPSWAVLEPSWAVLGPSWGRLGPSWGGLGLSWGRGWGHPGAVFGLSGAVQPSHQTTDTNPACCCCWFHATPGEFILHKIYDDALRMVTMLFCETAHISCISGRSSCGSVGASSCKLVFPCFWRFFIRARKLKSSSVIPLFLPGQSLSPILVGNKGHFTLSVICVLSWPALAGAFALQRVRLP